VVFCQILLQMGAAKRKIIDAIRAGHTWHLRNPPFANQVRWDVCLV
jgi:hypothetical protein